MSDPEDDSVVLDEIKALEDVLAADENSEPSIPVLNLKDVVGSRTNSPFHGFGEISDHESPQKNIGDATSNPITALETNLKLIENLRTTKRRLLILLEKCLDNQEMLDREIEDCKINATTSKRTALSPGMPYFKDANGWPAPQNDDAVAILNSDNYFNENIRDGLPWTTRDRNNLWMAVRREASETAWQTAVREAEETPTTSRNEGGDAGLSKVLNFSRNFRDLVGPLGTREFDWMMISKVDLRNRRCPEECRNMWKLVLHPDINRRRWTKEETAKFDDLMKKHNYKDWDRIAKELGTDRSGYLCFQRYVELRKISLSKEKIRWTEAEDEHLKRCVETLRTGSYIPWGEVCRYTDGRTKKQIYLRWKYVLAFDRKKGRFTADEDAKLLAAVKEYNQDFSAISSRVMPNRSSVQLSDHYLTLVQRKRGKPNHWTINEDASLLNYYKKFGNDWSSIAEKFSGKSRTQLRHRYSAIIRYRERGINLYEIPRFSDGKTKFSNDVVVVDDNKNSENFRVNENENENDEENAELTNDVDMELVNYFQIVPPTKKPGRKQKYYKLDELEDATKKLFNILKTLGGNLKIPENLENYELAERDKQLLKSLNDYKNMRDERDSMRIENLKYSRINESFHFRPLCSGDCNKNVTFSRNPNLDYVETDANCHVDVNTTMETPSNVIDAIGYDLNENLDEISKIFKCRKIDKSKKQKKVSTKIYVLGPDAYSKSMITVDKTNSQTLNSNNSNNVEKTLTTIKKSGRGKIWDGSISNGIIYHSYDTINCIEPNYHTLLGLKNILSTQNKICKIEHFHNTKNVEFRKSMEILRKRIFQIFKYSMGLSHIVRPEIFVKDVRGLETFDDDEVADDCHVVVKNVAKKKRLGNKKRGSSK